MLAFAFGEDLEFGFGEDVDVESAPAVTPERAVR